MKNPSSAVTGLLVGVSGCLATRRQEEKRRDGVISTTWALGCVWVLGGQPVWEQRWPRVQASPAETHQDCPCRTKNGSVFPKPRTALAVVTCEASWAQQDEKLRAETKNVILDTQEVPGNTQKQLRDSWRASGHHNVWMKEEGSLIF